MRPLATLSSVLVSLALVGSLAPASSGMALPGRTSPAVASAITPTLTPAATLGEETGRLVLLLDSSGSMKEPTAGGGTKIAAAKSALADVVEQLPESAEVGIRVFGAKVFSRTDVGACTDTQNVVPVGPLDRARLTSAVDDYEPYGETPIGNALKGAAADLGAARDGEKRTIVLLSDGEPTCAPDPCAVARRLRNQGIDLRINVVGLDVSGKARNILQCVARAGGGRYFDAASSEELTESMVQVSVRALRLFSLTGDPVQGGASTAAPAEVEPGDYVDRPLAEEAPKFYLVDKPENGSVSASVVMRPEHNSERILDVLSVVLLTPDGTTCVHDTTTDANVLGTQSIIGGAAYFAPVGIGSPNQSCLQAEQLLVQVGFNGPATPFGLRIRTYPEVRNLASLPGPVDADDKDSWEQPVPLRGTGTPVVGGASFESAPELSAGTTYADTLRPREQLLYKVKVADGQSVRMSARVETDPQAAKLQGVIGVQAELGAFNPLGKQLSATLNLDAGVQNSGRYTGSDPLSLTSAHAPVRYRNLETYENEARLDATAGYYYFALEMGKDPDPAAEQFAAPVRLAVALDGEKTGAPEYAGEVQGSSASPTPEPETTDDEAAGATDSADSTGPAASSTDALPVSLWVLVAGGLLLIGAIGFAVLAGFRAGKRRAG